MHLEVGPVVAPVIGIGWLGQEKGLAVFRQPTVEIGRDPDEALAAGPMPAFADIGDIWALMVKRPLKQ